MPKLFLLIMEGKLCRVKIKLTAVRLWSYSRSGNTEALARMIGNETGADMFRVTTVTPYPEAYRETTEVARAERDNNARPAINGRVENMADYDVAYIGVPNWWSTMPMPMFNFFRSSMICPAKLSYRSLLMAAVA